MAAVSVKSLKSLEYKKIIRCLHLLLIDKNNDLAVTLSWGKLGSLVVQCLIKALQTFCIYWQHVDKLLSTDMYVATDMISLKVLEMANMLLAYAAAGLVTWDLQYNWI